MMYEIISWLYFFLSRPENFVNGPELVKRKLDFQADGENVLQNLEPIEAAKAPEEGKLPEVDLLMTGASADESNLKCSSVDENTPKSLEQTPSSMVKHEEKDGLCSDKARFYFKSLIVLLLITLKTGRRELLLVRLSTLDFFSIFTIKYSLKHESSPNCSI